VIEMVNENPFEGYSKRVKTIVIDGKEILIKPNVRDAEAYMLLSKNMCEKDISKITMIFSNMVKRAYAENNVEVKQEDIDAFLAEHYGAFFYESAVLFGFMSKEEMELAKKKAISKIEIQD
jgi:aldehyde:ferredoxin oxidoreductase